MDLNHAADDFFVNVDLQTSLELPGSRETVLHFFEAVQKHLGDMTNFYQRETGQFVLEGDRESGSYRWIELQPRRLSAGYFNPPDGEAVCRMHRWLLESSVYFLGVRGLDIETLDVLFGFNMDYKGNRDAIVASAMLGGSPLGSVAGDLSACPIEYEPNMVMALDEECSTQARLSIETRCSSYQVRTGRYDDEPISVYFTIRRYPRPGETAPLKDIFTHQYNRCEDLVRRAVIPNVVQPIMTAITAAQ